jgi:hypothetical protein
VDFASWRQRHGEGARDGGSDAAQGDDEGADTWLRIIVAIGTPGTPPKDARH